MRQQITGATGLEPATSAVTGQRSNLLSYAPAMLGAPGRRSVPLQYAKAGPSAMSTSKLAGRPVSTRLSSMALVGPPPLLNSKPLAVLLEDLRDERSAGVPFPPGETRFSLTRTRRFAEDPLPLLLESYERFGPVFTLRLFHGNVVFMLGPAANHYITVSHASNFTWRNSHFRDLIGLMGDGLLTIDGEFHRRSRQIMLPAFHREHLAASVEAVVLETTRALDDLTPGGAGNSDTAPVGPVDLYHWTRGLAMRIAMRALFGLDPDREPARGTDAA